MIKDVENVYFTIIDKENVGLAEKFSVNPDSCDNSDFYREYLQYSAVSDLHTGKNTTHLLIDEDSNRIMGFVALRASAIISQGENDSTLGIPALEVSVLAVDREYERRGVGTALIDYVIAQADELHRQHVGLQYIILAADKLATGFYEHMAFTRIEDRWNKMPKENWSANCVPMALFLDFEKNYIVSFADLEDDFDDS